MKLTTRSRYGTRAMTELAIHYGQGPLMLEEISRRQDISRRYLEHIFANLRTAGLVKGLRGPRGGYVLTRAPDEILVSDIVSAVEGLLYIVDCLHDKQVCKLAKKCLTRPLWQEVNEAIMKVLESRSLADLVNSEKSCPAEVLMFDI